MAGLSRPGSLGPMDPVGVLLLSMPMHAEASSTRQFTVLGLSNNTKTCSATQTVNYQNIVRSNKPIHVDLC